MSYFCDEKCKIPISSQCLGLASDGHFSQDTRTRLLHAMSATFSVCPTLCKRSPRTALWRPWPWTVAPLPNKSRPAGFSTFSFLYEDGGVLLHRELSVSLWWGLPLYNGIKFKFKCGRDVKSTVGKKNWRLPEHWGRLAVAFHNYRITITAARSGGESTDTASCSKLRSTGRTYYPRW